MSDSEAGLYAAGLIMAKAILFLPQFVVVIAFPSMSKERPAAARWRWPWACLRCWAASASSAPC